MATEDFSPGEVTRLLKLWRDGDSAALERLTPIVYAELHRLARVNMVREHEGHLLQPSALVNEAFVRLIGGAPVDWESRTHFFAVFGRMMRQILIDFARAQSREKRGSGAPHVDLAEAIDAPGAPVRAARFIDLDAALDELSQYAERQVRVVEMRYFGGLENTEIAAVLGISEGTVMRDWRLARAFLYSRLEPGASPTL